MPFCINCGHQFADNAKFCAECGTPCNVETPVNNKRKTVYDGEIHKCPNCGEIINAFVSICPTCGLEIRGIKSSSVVREFANKLEQIELTRESQKSRSFIGKLYGSDGKLNITDEQKISLIRSFSIPNTKEDIFEFMILATSNIDLKLYGLGDMGVITASQRAISDAWLAKFEQTYEKAKFSFASTPDFYRIKEIHDKKIKQIALKKLEPFMLIFGILFIPWLIVLIFG